MEAHPMSNDKRESQTALRAVEHKNVPRGSIAVYVCKPQNRITRHVYFHPILGTTYVARDGFFRVVRDPCQG
jgi:hypothetical protein